MGDAGTAALHRRSRVNAFMHSVGGLLATASLLTPGSVPAGLTRVLYAAIVAACASMAALALVRRHRFGDVAVITGCLIGNVAIGAVTVVANHRPGGNSNLLLLLWPTLIAAIFLSGRLVAVQVAGTAVVGVAIYSGAAAGVGVSALQVLVLVISQAMAATVVLQLRRRLENALAEMESLSRTDPMTGLTNRRGLEERLPAVWSGAIRRQEKLAVLLLDVDHFKTVNDEHGHAAGDQVLVELAAVVSRGMRSEDVVSRIGGEELVVVASDGEGRAGVIGERLRAAVEGAALTVPLTVSIGAVTHRPLAGEDPVAEMWRVLELADAAMYEAKRSGRNRVVTALAGKTTESRPDAHPQPTPASTR